MGETHDAKAKMFTKSGARDLLTSLSTRRIRGMRTHALAAVLGASLLAAPFFVLPAGAETAATQPTQSYPALQKKLAEQKTEIDRLKKAVTDQAAEIQGLRSDLLAAQREADNRKGRVASASEPKVGMSEYDLKAYAEKKGLTYRTTSEDADIVWVELYSMERNVAGYSHKTALSAAIGVVDRKVVKITHGY